MLHVKLQYIYPDRRHFYLKKQYSIYCTYSTHTQRYDMQINGIFKANCYAIIFANKELSS